jgi:hypothetical protein
LKLSGLISCVGIIIEAKHEGKTQAVSGSHFVTPDLTQDDTSGGTHKRRLNEKGKQALQRQIEMTKPHGTTFKATLMYVDKTVSLGGTSSEAQQAGAAMEAIEQFLNSDRGERQFGAVE